jgi:hypothetical protein
MKCAVIGDDSSEIEKIKSIPTPRIQFLTF